MVDRRDGLRRRIYLGCLLLGTPIIAATWVVQRDTDPFIEIVYPPYIATHAAIAIGLLRRRVSVRSAERAVLLSVVVVFLSSLAVRVLRVEDLSELQDAMTVSTLLVINLMVTLAYVAFETRQAMRIALGIVGAFVAIVAGRVVPDLFAGQVGGEAVGLLQVVMFLVASAGLVHVLAQVKEQAAEARSTAAAMTALANTDPLTGIANRRRLHAVLDARVADAEAHGDPLSVVLLDLDHFKQVNDTHGHDTGDAVLRRVAEVLGDLVGQADLLGRWGGEEFLVIGARSELEVAALAERCRAGLAAELFPGVGHVTASFGVASHEAGDTAWRLLRRADDALYDAKAAGRDQVRHHADRWDDRSSLTA